MLRCLHKSAKVVLQGSVTTSKGDKRRNFASIQIVQKVSAYIKHYKKILALYFKHTGLLPCNHDDDALGVNVFNGLLELPVNPLVGRSESRVIRIL